MPNHNTPIVTSWSVDFKGSVYPNGFILADIRAARCFLLRHLLLERVVVVVAVAAMAVARTMGDGMIIHGRKARFQVQAGAVFIPRTIRTTPPSLLTQFLPARRMMSLSPDITIIVRQHT